MKTKHFFSIILIALFSLCGEISKADDFSYTYHGKKLYYNITSSNTIEVTYTTYNEKYSDDIVIPAEVTYNNETYKVTSIEYEAFPICIDLTSITIPNSVTSIGKWAFSDCENLNTIYLKCVNPPEIKISTFSNVSSNVKIYVPKGSLNSYKNADGWGEFSNIQEY